MESNKGLFSYLTWLLPKELIRTWRARLQAVRSWVPSETEAGGPSINMTSEKNMVGKGQGI